MRAKTIIKEILSWIFLYGIYCYVSALVSNFVYNTLQTEYLDDMVRSLSPFLLLGINFFIIKRKRPNNSDENKIKSLSSSKIFGIVTKIIITVVTIFTAVFIIITVMRYSAYFFQGV